MLNPATLRVSAVLAVGGVRLSVCLSVILVHCIETAKDIKLSLGLEAPSFQFLSPTAVTHVQGNLFVGLLNKRAQFQANIYFGNGIQERPTITVER